MAGVRDRFDPGDGYMKSPSRMPNVQTAAERGPSNLDAEGARLKARLGGSQMAASVEQTEGLGSGSHGVPGVREISFGMSSPAAPEEPMNSSQGTNRRSLRG